MEKRMERWAVENRMELCMRYLYRARDAAGERLFVFHALPALLAEHRRSSSFLQEMRQLLFEARDKQTAEHFRLIFTPQKAEAMRVCCRWSWNKVRWVWARGQHVVPRPGRE